jgi:hypothetical protein
MTPIKAYQDNYGGLHKTAEAAKDANLRGAFNNWHSGINVYSFQVVNFIKENKKLIKEYLDL